MIKNLKTRTIFLLIAIFYAVGDFIWWKINTPIIPMDISALHFCDIFQNGCLYFNAPLITWIMKGMFAIFGVTNFDLQIICVNYIFFLIALYFIYKLGIEFKDSKTGNIAMILLALVPAIYGLSRQYGHQDYHVMVVMIINIYCLIKTNDFKDRKWSILYGISVGIGLLVKDEFLAYFFTPWLYVVIKSLVNKIERQKITNIITTILIGSLIAGCHYFRFEIINKILFEPIFATQSVFAFDSLKILTLGLSNELLSPIIFIIFLIALICLLKNYKYNKKYILILWIVVPWSIIMFMPHHKVAEYGVGFIPSIILISSLFIENLKFKKIVLFITILIGLIQYINFSYATGTPKIDDSNNIYFDKYNLVYHDKEQSNIAIDLIKYINDNFKGYNILFEDLQFLKSIDIWSIRSCMHLQNLKFSISDIFVETNIEDYDIIIIIGKIRTPQERTSEELMLFKNKTYDDVYNYYVTRKENIDSNFIKINEFYLGGQEEERKITIFKKNI